MFWLVATFMGRPGKENPSCIAAAVNLCGATSCAVRLQQGVCGVVGSDEEGGESGGGGGGKGDTPQLVPAVGGEQHLE